MALSHHDRHTPATYTAPRDVNPSVGSSPTGGTVGFVSAYRVKRECGRGAEPELLLWWRRNIEADCCTD